MKKESSEKSETEKNSPKSSGRKCCGKRKSSIPPDRKAPDTDEEGIGVVHEPQ